MSNTKLCFGSKQKKQSKKVKKWAACDIVDCLTRLTAAAFLLHGPSDWTNRSFALGPFFHLLRQFVVSLFNKVFVFTAKNIRNFKTQFVIGFF